MHCLDFIKSVFSDVENPPKKHFTVTSSSLGLRREKSRGEGTHQSGVDQALEGVWVREVIKY